MIASIIRNLIQQRDLGQIDLVNNGTGSQDREELIMKTWFITGASRGFGALMTREVLTAGDAVVATARNPKTITDQFGDHANLRLHRKRLPRLDPPRSAR